ncbi:hypothetical protein [Corynebacterium timonense]|uniref:Uncharacterized protein n=1 Tax=Corynebacterium timonense TaxID=441500 RepID=A0A1H1T5Z5_9CORY|nr:hypothetical protein [Corynebacterium timonense]SDS55608.1 hypothetical protein SAMN04488539_1907 [Corynebacterium timonense]
MAGMFPTMVSDPNDPNRRYNQPAGTEKPKALTRAFRLFVVACVLMLLTGMMLLAGGFPEGADEAFREPFMRNMRFTAWGNIILALALGATAAYVDRGSAPARRFAAGFSAAAIFLNIAAFALRVSAWASFIIVVLLAVAVWMMFRPPANAWVRATTSGLQGQG